ncbi:hypothetical protein ACFLZ6_02340 [Nanoarchaeota archaeon]
MKTKVCKYCKGKFSEIEFPRTFTRMITCGSSSCMGKRRKELWRKKHSQIKRR